MAELNISLENVEASVLEAVYLQGYEDARKDFMSCIESFHKEVIMQDETKNPFQIRNCSNCKYRKLSYLENPCVKCKWCNNSNTEDYWTAREEE